MSAPFVSIVMTAYNAEAFLPVSVPAALAQDYPRFELIVLDDGSTDASRQICEAIDDPRLRYVPRGRLGRARALNEAIALADGEYVAINDADDLSFPNRLTNAMRFLTEHIEASLVGTAYVATEVFRALRPDDLHGHPDPSKDRVAWITPPRLYRNNPFVHSTVVFSKAAWDRVGGYDENLPMCIDYDLFLRLGASARIALLPMRTVLQCIHQTSYFRQRPNSEYLATLIRIRNRARDQLQLPFWLRAYDLIPYWLALRSAMIQRFKQP